MSNKGDTMSETLKVKKWGNSLGLVLPKEFVEKEHLEEGDRVIISVIKEADLTPFYGKLKRKMSGQAFKDLVREGWDK